MNQLNHNENKDATAWVSNLVTVHQEDNKDLVNQNHVNSLPESVSSTEGDLRSILSPVKPVNLLPQVPINSNTYRKLSENEEHDCEIIGKTLMRYNS